MRFTEYKFDPDSLAQKTEEMRAGLKRNKGREDLAVFGCQIIREEIAKNPLNYLRYGPYWWAVKAIARTCGINFGDIGYELMEREYSCANDDQTMVAAFEFRDFARRNFFRGNRVFLLGDEEEWTLNDPDMEAMARGE